MASTYIDEACIVGVGETPYARGPDKTSFELGLQATMAACEDAGLDPHEIDGRIAGEAEDYAANLGIKDIRFSAVLRLGGANNIAALEVASLALAHGICNYVPIPSTATSFSGVRAHHSTANVGAGISAAIGARDYYLPYGIQAAPQNYALMAKRHMLIYGTKQEQLGAVAHRKHAQLHPNALMHGTPMTMEDYLNSRWIVELFHLLDCSLETDGGAAVSVCTVKKSDAQISDR